jgi:hypothetical protein
MTLYVDKYNGVWKYEVSDDPVFGAHHWTLISKTDEKQHAEFTIGSGQNDESVKHLAPFKKLVAASEYEFPKHKVNDTVFVDYYFRDDCMTSLDKVFTSHECAGGKNKPAIPAIIVEVKENVYVIAVRYQVPRDKVYT